MKKARLFFVILSLCFLLGCNNAASDNTQPPSTSETKADSALQMPDEMKEVVEDPNIQWMAGMLTVIENAEMLQGISQESYEVYADPGNEIHATVTVQNGLTKTQRFYLMVFADGIPVEFTADERTYLSYPVDLEPQQKSFEIKFDKEFALNMGRLDFVLSFAENLQEKFPILTYTIWIDLDDNPLLPASIWDTKEQRMGLQDKFGRGTYGAWIWNEGVTPADTDNVSATKVSVQEGEKFLLEAIAGSPGLYRTVLVVNDAPVEVVINGEKRPYLDWNSTGTNMLQFPIHIEDMPSNGCIYTITTPLDTVDLARHILASGKIEVFPFKEE